MGESTNASFIVEGRHERRREMFESEEEEERGMRRRAALSSESWCYHRYGHREMTPPFIKTVNGNTENSARQQQQRLAARWRCQRPSNVPVSSISFVCKKRNSTTPHPRLYQTARMEWLVSQAGDGVPTEKEKK